MNSSSSQRPAHHARVWAVRIWAVMVGIAFFLLGMQRGFAQGETPLTSSSPTSSPSAGTTAGKNTSTEPALKDRVRVIRKFAAEHHPELATLLDRLEKSNPRQYQAAIEDLGRTIDRLERIRERTPDRYAVELEDWKLTSRIRLLGARLTMGNDEEVKAQLEQLLRERAQFRMNNLITERERVNRRLERIDRQLETATKEFESRIQRELVEFEAQAAKTAKARKKAAKTSSPAEQSEDSKSRSTATPSDPLAPATSAKP